MVFSMPGADGGGGLFGVQPTPVCHQYRVALSTDRHTLSTDLVHINIKYRKHIDKFLS